MFKTNISDYKGFQRTVEMKEQELNESFKILTTKCNLVHYLDGVEIPDLNKTIIFVNDNTAMIPTGEVDENDEPVLTDLYGAKVYGADKKELTLSQAIIMEGKEAKIFKESNADQNQNQGQQNQNQNQQRQTQNSQPKASNSMTKWKEEQRKLIDQQIKDLGAE